MHPPQHIVAKLEEINPNVRLGWTARKYAGAPAGGAFAVLDLYPRALAEQSFEAWWDDSGPVFGSSYDPLQRIPIIKKWYTPIQVFNGDVVGWVKHASRTDKQFARYIRERNERLIKERTDARKDMAGELGEELYWRGQRGTEPVPTIPDKDVTAADKAKLDGSWEGNAAPEKPIEAGGVGMT